MDKQYYDHRCVLCPKCCFHLPAGPRESIGLLVSFPEGCRRYGYSFNIERYPEDADDCEGFLTVSQFEAAERAKEMQKKKRK